MIAVRKRKHDICVAWYAHIILYERTSMQIFQTHYTEAFLGGIHRPISSRWLQVPWRQIDARTSATTRFSRMWLECHKHQIALNSLTHCGLVTPYGVIQLGQNCAWRHQAITWTNVDIYEVLESRHWSHFKLVARRVKGCRLWWYMIYIYIYIY